MTAHDREEMIDRLLGPRRPLYGPWQPARPAEWPALTIEQERLLDRLAERRAFGGCTLLGLTYGGGL